MINKIIIAGFGGQGIILTGKIVAYAAMAQGLNVTHFPSYGAEMRGGTCNCSVIISDTEISSPVIPHPDIALIMNAPSRTKFEPRCRENGIIIYNRTMVEEKTGREDLSSYYIDATERAEKIGSFRAANMEMLGAFCAITKLVELNTILDAVPNVVSARNQKLIDINLSAIQDGYKQFSK
jgi:2-oxoglutarate ferredoxin oxidoreductase subunit gamma